MAKIKKLKQIQSILASSKVELRKKYKVKELGIFGSYARGQQKKTSDVDILVRFNPNATLFDFVGLGNYLEEKLKIKVDVVSENGIRPELRSNIVKGVLKV
ncbi:nucleotidyltransferase family protein [Candidatus Woesearchaeota archaeon]|nr:nucleotidyltransferase family protein [Candidatus Woesearchaeota archaeon]